MVTYPDSATNTRLIGAVINIKISLDETSATCCVVDIEGCETDSPFDLKVLAIIRDGKYIWSNSYSLHSCV